MIVGRRFRFAGHSPAYHHSPPQRGDGAMPDPGWVLVGLAILQTILSGPTIIRDWRNMVATGTVAAPSRPPGRLVILMAVVVVFSWLAAGFDVFGKRWFAEPAYAAAYLTPDRQTVFRSGALSIINAAGNLPPVRIETVSEPEAGRFASALVDLFIISGLAIQTDAQGNRVVGVPSHRLDPGITIVASVSSPASILAAEAVRVGFERLGIQTKRATDKNRNGDYLIVEVGPAP
jgi:hypothetical protein